jgi:hypothetical protein
MVHPCYLKHKVLYIFLIRIYSHKGLFLKLYINMRAGEGEEEFAEWLLKLGNGELFNELV